MGFEPGPEFLPAASSRSGNNLVQPSGNRHRIHKTDRGLATPCNDLTNPHRPMPSYYLGIDASKGYADFVLVDQHKQLVEHVFQLDDTFEGHHRLYELLHGFCQRRPEAHLLAGIESTGGYENNWLSALRRFQASLPVAVAHLNAFAVANHRKAALRRNTTDATSARNVAEYLIAHPEQVRYHNEDVLSSLRRHFGLVELLVKQRTQLRNQLGSLLYSAHPELLAYCKNGTPQWLLKVLLRYPTAQRVARARAKTLAGIPYVSLERAQSLIEAARRSVASASDDDTETLIEETARQILHLRQVIARQTQTLKTRCDVPELELLKSFDGISDYTAIGLLLEIESVERFASAKKLAAYFGLHPVYKISGDGLGAMRMSKQGRPRARALLFMVTMTAIQANPVIAPLYREKVAAGMEKMAAIGLCMHKTLRMLYGMLKHGHRFDPEIDRKNQHRARQPQAQAEQRMLEKKRRYQDFDRQAPISQRQTQKRRQQKSSQSELVAEHGMVASTTASPG